MAIAVCPNGHVQDRPTARFCKVCGLPLTTAPQPDPVNGVCARGHPQIRAGARFCYQCQAPVNSAVDAAPNAANGICAQGHSQVRAGARHCYVCGAPVYGLGQVSTAYVPTGPLINDRYELRGELGRGGMASVVYRAADVPAGGYEYALKEIDADQLQPASDRAELLRAFQREADLLQRLDHPYIVRVYESFQVDAKYYMVMDLVLGKTLAALLETSPGGFPETRVLGWAEQLCEALGYLHTQKPPIIYRDMKPQNVMVEDGSGEVKIIDFGIAREFKGGKKKSDTIKFGTSGYAPPEQYGKSGVETSPASDVYALGAMLHQLLSGQDPADSPLQFDFLCLSRPPISASAHTIDALKRALDSSPADRFQSVDDFRQALMGEIAAKDKKSERAERPDRASGIAGGLQLSTTQLDLGRVEKGGAQPARQTVTVTASGRAKISARSAWLAAAPSTIDRHGQVEVSVQTEKLPLGHRSWTAPDVLRPLRSLPRNNRGWLGLVLLVALLIPGLRLIAIALAGGWLGLYVLLRLSEWLLPRMVAKPLEHSGQIVVADGPAQKSIRVKVTAIPSAWRLLIGWGGLLLSIGLAGGCIVCGLAALILALGG